MRWIFWTWPDSKPSSSKPWVSDIGAAPREWAPPVIGTSAVSGEGTDELVEAIQRHRRVAFESRPGRERSLAIAAFRLRKTAENLLLERLGEVVSQADKPLAARLARRDADPYSLAGELLGSSFQRTHADEHDAQSSAA